MSDSFIGFPRMTDSYLAGQDVLYAQFNNVNFYIEDYMQENLYFNIFKNLFPSIKFRKIFPLNGKDNVIDHAKTYPSDKSKIHVVDADFDELLGRKESISSLFYLDRYSIENHLINRQALYELIREKNPKLKDQDIKGLFVYNDLRSCCKIVLKELTCAFILISKYSLGIEYFSLEPGRDVDLSSRPVTFKNTFVLNYLNHVETSIKLLDGRFTLNSQSKEFSKHFRSFELCWKHVPGKYLMNFTKFYLTKNGLINQCSLESFTYRLSKECDKEDFEPLRIAINQFVGG